MSEKNAYSTLRKNAFKPGDRIDRIENAVVTGMPDINGCLAVEGHDGIEFWIEAKAPKEPKRSTTPLFGSNHKLSQDQKNWFKRQDRAGGRGFVYIETDNHRMLLHGGHSDHINEMTLNELLDLAIWKTTKPTRNHEDWDRFRDAIRYNIPF